MPQTTLYNKAGKDVGSVELSDALFAAPVNAAVLHQVVTAQLAGRRTGTHGGFFARRAGPDSAGVGPVAAHGRCGHRALTR